MKITEEQAESYIPTDEKPNVGSVFDDIKERISSPFIFSFVVSWIFANWKIWIGLFFYSFYELSQSGYDGYIDFINKEVSWWTGLILPLSGAVFYCFLFPFLRNTVKYSQAWFHRRSTNKINDLAGTITLPVRKMLEYRTNLYNTEKTIQTILKDEKGILAERDVFRQENADLQLLVSKQGEQLKRLKEANNINVLDGNWEVTKSLEFGPSLLRLKISAGLVYFADFADKSEPVYVVTNFFCDIIDLKLVMEFHPKTNDRNLIVYHLDISNGWKELKGKENWEGEVTFIRTSIPHFLPNIKN